MKLSKEQFSRFKELTAKVKAGKASSAEEAELADLQAMKNIKGSNDLAWWKNYPDLLRDVVNFPFNWIPGTKVTVTGFGGVVDTLALGNVAIAHVAPAIGLSVSDADAFNSQIRQLWITMHRKYRGIGTYQKADLGIAILAITSFFETLAKFERIYGVLNAYHIGNRVVPYGLMEALHIGSTLPEELADFRYFLNLCIEKSRQLCLPKGLSVMLSDIVAISNLFKDSANRRAFIFGFDTDHFGVYDATSISSGGCVKYKVFSDYMNDVTPNQFAGFNLRDIRDILNEQLNALLNDDDIQQMCSDLVAAFGPENVLTLTNVPTDYKVEPVEDYERSIQFHNLTICGEIMTIYRDNAVGNALANSFRSNSVPIVIYQYDNTVYCELGRGSISNAYYLSNGKNYPVIASPSSQIGKRGELLFDTWVDQPGETEIMCGTRYSSLVGERTLLAANNYKQDIVAFGTKVVQQVSIYAYEDGTAGYHEYDVYGTVIDLSSFTTNYAEILSLTQMDWAPMLFINDSGDTTLLGDIDNFTKISADNLLRIHEVALLSGYYIPMLGKD